MKRYKKKFLPEIKPKKNKHEMIENTVLKTLIEPRSDNEFLQSISNANMKRVLESIKNGTVIFMGQYSKSRTKEAIEYLERTIKENTV